MKPEIKKRAEELNENKKTLSTRVSMKAHRDRDAIALKTGYNKAVVIELALEFFRKQIEGK